MLLTTPLCLHISNSNFLFFFILGLRMRAIRILGSEVMLPRGLVGLGLDTLDNSGPEIAQVSMPSALTSKGHEVDI